MEDKLPLILIVGALGFVIIGLTFKVTHLESQHNEDIKNIVNVIDNIVELDSIQTGLIESFKKK